MQHKPFLIPRFPYEEGCEQSGNLFVGISSARISIEGISAIIQPVV
jgi:hypothetical protein